MKEKEMLDVLANKFHADVNTSIQEIAGLLWLKEMHTQCAFYNAIEIRRWKKTISWGSATEFYSGILQYSPHAISHRYDLAHIVRA